MPLVTMPPGTIRSSQRQTLCAPIAFWAQAHKKTRMYNILCSIRTGVIMLCLMLCVPYMASSATLEGTSPEQLIAYVRAQHFGKYPASEGYPSIGKALEKFFSRGAWKYEMRNFPSEIISFSGIADINGKKARFTWIFSIITLKEGVFPFPYGAVMHESILVNDTRASQKEMGDILAAVMLN